VERVIIQSAIDKAKAVTPKLITDTHVYHASKWKTQNEKFEAEKLRLKSLKLKKSRETQYDYDYRMYVPRDRAIGCDGIVRTVRVRNEEPASRAEGTEFKRLFNAFAEMRKTGIDAKWNIRANSWREYYSDIPFDGKPRVTHYKEIGPSSRLLADGLSWNREWESLRDQMFIDTWNGARDETIKTLTKHGFRVEQNPDSDDKDHLVILFRGEVEASYSIWNWIDNCISDSPVEPPPIP